MSKIDVGIIGTGRVGLPLALSLSQKKLGVIGFDINKDRVDQINNKIMPFREKDCDILIKDVNLYATSDFSLIADVRNIIITVGTPLLSHIETDLSQIQNVLNTIKKYLRVKQNIILRSTVAPGTTEYVKKYLERATGFKIGRDLFLSFCPERIMEGKALEELSNLPQIVGSEDKISASRSEQLFSSLVNHILHTDYISAELIKLFNNISRYVRFGLANQFALIAEEYNKNIFEIIDMANYNYPRDKIALPGLTAGTCLRKDFGMINENIPYQDILLSAWKVNEYMPNFLVKKLKNKTRLTGKNIGILGYTFKKDSDDVRDSLVPKLIRYLEREVPNSLIVHDPYLKEINNKIFKISLEDIVEKAEIIILAINHSLYEENIDLIIKQSKAYTWFVDIWNISKRCKIFFQKGD